MSAFSLVLIVVFAGILNGFYVFPVKRDNIETSFLWIFFATLTFILLPSIALIYAFSQHTVIFTSLNLISISLVGIVYGAGIFLIARSMSYIGVGVPFAISLALGTLSGSIFSSIVSHKLIQNLTVWLVVSYILFAVSIILYSKAVSLRDGATNKKWSIGLTLCLIGSVFQALQGACLSYFSNVIKLAQGGFADQLVPWALIFIPCGVVFILGNWLQIKKKGTLREPINRARILKWGLYMTLFNISSVVLYTIANSHAQLFSERYLWAIFMGTIVLGSTLCSFVKREWVSASKKAISVNLIGMFFLGLSIFMMCYGSVM